MDTQHQGEEATESTLPPRKSVDPRIIIAGVALLNGFLLGVLIDMPDAQETAEIASNRVISEAAREQVQSEINKASNELIAQAAVSRGLCVAKEQVNENNPTPAQ